MTWETFRDRWKAVVAQIPPRTRKGKIARNLVLLLLIAVAGWVVAGAPALTTMWQFRRAERQYFVGPSEVIAHLETDWANWGAHRLLVGETEESYILYMPDGGGNSYRNFEIWEKQSGPMLVPAPECNTLPSFGEAAPFVLLTELPAARAEVEFTLPEGYFPSSSEGLRPRGAVYHAEGTCQSGVFAFDLPQGLPREDEIEEPYTPLELTTEQYHDLYALRSWSTDLRCEEQIILPVPVTIRLWDEQGTLIYDETQIYGAERGNADEP